MTESSWSTTPQQKQREFQNSKRWILTANSEGRTQQSLDQRPAFAQAKRECKRLHDEHLTRTQQEYRPIPRSQQVRQRKEQQFEGSEEFDYVVDPKTGWRFQKESRGCLPTASSSSSHWDRNHWKTSNWDSQHSSRPDDLWKNSQGWDQFRLLGEKTSSQPTGSVNSTPTNTARDELHSMITFHHANTRGSRAAKLRIAHLCVAKQVSSTCHDWPQAQVLCHFPLLFFPTISPTLTRFLVHDELFPYDVPQQSDGSTQIPSLTGYKPRVIDTTVIETEAIEPEDLEPRRIECDRNLGTDPYQLQERFMWDNYQNPIAEDVEGFGKVGTEKSHVQSQMHADFDSVESIAVSDLEDVDFQKCWLHHCMCKIERTVDHLEYQLHRVNLLQWYRRERSNCKAHSSWPQGRFDVKFISGNESIGETCCNVFTRNRRTGKPNQEFYFQKRWSVESGKISSWR